MGTVAGSGGGDGDGAETALMPATTTPGSEDPKKRPGFFGRLFARKDTTTDAGKPELDGTAAAAGPAADNGGEENDNPAEAERPISPVCVDPPLGLLRGIGS